jgi:Histidine kinase-, DNA gyrase B-, and HSP90-like ATPase
VFYDSLSVFRLPVPILKCVPSKDAKFELWPLRFEIDESGVLWDIISKSIYTGKHDYLRELIQNSIDACLRRIYEDSESTQLSPAPRSWSLTNYKPTVLIVVSRRKDEMVVSDNGIGMDRHIIQEFLFRVAGSGMKKSSADRPFKFPSIATFGVGFISVLTRASKLRLITKRVSKTDTSNKSHGICVQLDANLRDAIVEKDSACPEGTCVLLKAKDPQYLKGIEEFLLNTFQYPSAEISFIDWDKIDSVVNSIKNYHVPVNLDLYQIAERHLQEQSGDIEGILLDTVKFIDAATKGIHVENARIKREDAERKDGVYTPLISIAENPIVTINAVEPEAVPITSAWYFSLGNSSEIEGGRSLKTTTHRVNLYAKLVTIPVQFTDHVLGVEWRSLHSFLVSRGVLTRKMSFVRTSRFASRTFALPSEDLIDTDSYYDAISEQLEDSEDNPNDLVEEMRSRHERWRYGEPESRGFRGTMLISDRHGIKRYHDVNFDEIDAAERLRDIDVEDFFESDFPVNLDATEALLWYRRKRQAVYQDGIRLPIELCDIAPIGSVVGVANLVADSRLSYNVSRSAIDESEDKLRVWRSNVGMHILKKVTASVIQVLDQLLIAYEWGDLWTGENDGSLSKFRLWMKLTNQ